MSTYQPYGGYNQDYNTGGGDYNSGGFDSNGGGSQSAKTPSRSSLTPVTIKQINDSKAPVQDGDFTIHGLELSQVSFVGVVRSVTDNTTSLQIQLEDGTGQLEIRAWVDEKAPEGANSFLVQGQYVFATGSIKEFGGRKQIQHATFRPITDYNEVIYHHLSAIDAHLGAKGILPSNTSATKVDNGLFGSKPSQGEMGGSVADRIYEFITESTASMPEGVPVQYVAQSLNLLVDDVVLHCGKLTEDAKIYAGYEENTFLAV